MHLNDNFEYRSICDVHENNIEELLSLQWLANRVGSEKCQNDIKKQLNTERKQLLLIKEFIKYCQKSESCLMGYASKLISQEGFNFQEEPKIFFKK